ncbi:NAD(P)H-binding protein [Levilactobacillus bambusae]|uniref:NAD(P)-dependent oxidoreductase n=1 Tax=Levilactobacillus bambusae TaxID=2024736 RepID=A0A2V1MZC9_9LACO|nr:NAD(P)H-binding protein [Levilactobacillus bambusae]PWG00113.1 NAD(P)-dependent oxidoreductase [Levilactobacillus bambusae]
MEKVLILGASGTIGGVVRERLLEDTDAQLTLFCRHASGILHQDPDRETAFDGDAEKLADLEAVMAGQDVVFVALRGRNLDLMAQNITQSMTDAGVKRLVFITSMGIYNEVPARYGESKNLDHNPSLHVYRKAADIVESSNTDYTVIRPAWYDFGATVYELTKKGEQPGGNCVSVDAVGHYVLQLVKDPAQDVRASVGINRPQ